MHREGQLRLNDFVVEDGVNAYLKKNYCMTLLQAYKSLNDVALKTPKILHKGKETDT